MNFKKLKYITAVDGAGSVSAAAKRLHISQSAVTKAVADIEEELGFSLFDRRAYGVATTPAGRDFIDRAARILSDVDRLSSDMKNGRLTKDLLLRVAVTPASLEGLMNRSVISLLTQWPDIRLHMRGAPLETGIMLLRQGDVDTLVGPRSALENEPGFVCSELPSMRSFLYGRQGHPLVGLKNLSPRDITAFPIIVPDIQGPLVTPLLNVLDLLGDNPLGRMNVIETYAIGAGIIEKSDAVGVVLGNFAESSGFANRFSILDFDMGGALPMAVARLKTQKVGRALSRFLSQVKKFPPTG